MGDSWGINIPTFFSLGRPPLKPVWYAPESSRGHGGSSYEWLGPLGTLYWLLLILLLHPQQRHSSRRPQSPCVWGSSVRTHPEECLTEVRAADFHGHRLRGTLPSHALPQPLPKSSNGDYDRGLLCASWSRAYFMQCCVLLHDSP